MPSLLFNQCIKFCTLRASEVKVNGVVGRNGKVEKNKGANYYTLNTEYVNRLIVNNLLTILVYIKLGMGVSILL